MTRDEEGRQSESMRDQEKRTDRLGERDRMGTSNDKNFASSPPDQENRQLDQTTNREDNQRTRTDDPDMDLNSTDTEIRHQLPPLPSKNIELHRQLTHQINQSSYSSTKILIQFLIGLSNLVLLGGSLAGLVVHFYQKYLLPKLKIRNDVLLELIRSCLKSHTEFKLKLIDIIQIFPRMYVLANKVKQKNLNSNTVEHSIQTETRTDAKIDGVDTSLACVSIQPSTPTPPSHQDPSTLKTLDTSELNPTEQQSDSSSNLNQPIYDGLESLAAAFRKKRGLPSLPNSNQKMNITTKQISQDIRQIRLDLNITSSLYANNDTINSGFNNYNNPYLNGLNSVQSTTDSMNENRNQVVLEESRHANLLLKNEIRSLKGSLLNRRNFVTWKPPLTT